MTNARRIAAAAMFIVAAGISSPLAQAEKVLHRANDLSYGGKESLDPISPSRFPCMVMATRLSAGQ